MFPLHWWAQKSKLAILLTVKMLDSKTPCVMGRDDTSYRLYSVKFLPLPFNSANRPLTHQYPLPTCFRLTGP